MIFYRNHTQVRWRGARLASLVLVILAWMTPSLLADDKKPASSKPSADALMKALPDLSIPNSAEYLPRLKVTLESEAKFANADPMFRSMYMQGRGTLFSFVGLYQKALADFDPGEHTKPASLKPDALEGLEAQDALQAILHLADQHQVIMINEAHHVPLHRALTIQLLAGLYAKGFRYFAAETLTHEDPKLGERGYPTLKTGFYTAEPLYGELVRTALRLGYHVVPYEAEKTQSPYIAGDPVAAQNEREEGQAQNLKQRILDKDPKAKVLVHAGYGHITKKPTTWDFGKKKGEIRLMANRFKTLTGIDPVTVDQVEMTEKNTPALEHPLFRLAIQNGLVKDRPVVLRQNQTKTYFVPAKFQGSYDLVVFHPRSHFENGRPTWMAVGDARRPQVLPQAKRPAKGAWFLAQGFYANEELKNAIPADQIAYEADSPPPTLWLPAGSFRFRIVDEAGKTVHEWSK